MIVRPGIELANLTDTGDRLRGAISGRNANGGALLTFAPGFQPSRWCGRRGVAEPATRLTI